MVPVIVDPFEGMSENDWIDYFESQGCPDDE